MLSHRTLIEEMKKMPPLHYNNIGPLVNTLKETLKLVKAVQGSPMVEVQHITPAQNVQVIGQATVCFRAAVCCLEVEWPAKQSLAEVQAGVKHLCETVQNNNVTLPKQILDAIEMWDSGRQLFERQKTRCCPSRYGAGSRADKGGGLARQDVG